MHTAPMELEDLDAVRSQERYARRYERAYLAHPNPQDPDYPGDEYDDAPNPRSLP